jgi:hypothetical protein
LEQLQLRRRRVVLRVHQGLEPDAAGK